MRLYLIRHAQSANNDLYTRTGGSQGRTADPPLTDLGHRQAHLLAQHLAGGIPDTFDPDRLIGPYAARHDRLGYDLTHLYCSLMTRSVQTGSYVAEATGLPLVGWPEIHERGGLHILDEASGEETGVSGPNRAHFTEHFPHLALPDSIGEAGWWSRPKETVAEALGRAGVVLAQLLERHGGTEDRVALISHAGFFQSFMRVLLSIADDFTVPQTSVEEMWFGVSNTAVSRIEFDEKAVIIRYLNRVDFLPNELITG